MHWQAGGNEVEAGSCQSKGQEATDPSDPSRSTQSLGRGVRDIPRSCTACAFQKREHNQDMV